MRNHILNSTTQYAKFFDVPSFRPQQFPGEHIAECGATEVAQRRRPRTDLLNIQRRAFSRGVLPVRTVHQCRKLPDLPSRDPYLPRCEKTLYLSNSIGIEEICNRKRSWPGSLNSFAPASTPYKSEVLVTLFRWSKITEVLWVIS